MADKTTDSKPESGEQAKTVSFKLGLGIFFMPYIFSWFTLRKGHSTKAKAISFVWLAILVMPILFGGKKSDTTSNSADLKKTSRLIYG